MVPRPLVIMGISEALDALPVTLLTGPRQCGKTTIAREICGTRGGTYYYLEDPETPLQPESAKLVLKEKTGLVVIDEVQRQPSLFPLLRVLADRPHNKARFLLLGSASLALVRGASETLAGRIAYVEMGGFSLFEVGVAAQDDLWTRGGFPRSTLAETDALSLLWRKQFVQSFLERDIPQLGIRVPAIALRRFWTMVAHLHGQIWNAALLARSLGTKEDTARHYLDIVTGAFMVRQLPPWFENTRKRLVKAPKVYVRDTGVLHALLGLGDKAALQAHPKLGFSWEGFAIEQILSLSCGQSAAYFYKTHGGTELDLLLVRGKDRIGFEFKYEDSPRTQKAMHVVLEDLRLDKLWVVTPGEERHPLTSHIEVIPLAQCLRELAT